MCGLWLLGGLPAGSSAQEAPGTVVIVRVPRDAAVIARIRAELEANEWRVRELGPDSNSARAPLASLMTVANARAALRMQPERAAIELWVASESDAAGSGEVVALPGGELDDALLAVRATEALRARGLRLPRRAEAGGLTTAGGAVAVGAAAASGEPAAPGGTPSGVNEEERKAAEAAAARATAEARAREQAERERAEKERLEQERAAQEAAAEEEEEAEEEEAEEAESESTESTPAGPDGGSMLFVEVGPAIGYSAGGASPIWAVWANLRVQPSALWSISALGFVPFAGGTYTRDLSSSESPAPQGTGHMRSVILGLTADLHGVVYRGVELSAGAGGAFLIVDMVGESASDTSQPASDRGYTGAGIVRVGVQLSLGSLFRLSGRAVFGVTQKMQDNLVQGMPVQDPVTWGPLFVLGTIALEFAFPEPTR